MGSPAPHLLAPGGHTAARTPFWAPMPAGHLPIAHSALTVPPAPVRRWSFVSVLWWLIPCAHLTRLREARGLANILSGHLRKVPPEEISAELLE